MILRHRPDGQCLQCGRIKSELMSDDEKPYKPIYIYCDECFDKWYADYKRKGRYQY